jgi:hypothetical protein
MGNQRKLHKGDRVSWKSHSGRAHGVVEGEITERTRAAGRTVNASREEPQYLIRNDHSGRLAVHRPQVLQREQA